MLCEVVQQDVYCQYQCVEAAMLALGMHTRQAVSDAYAAWLGARWLVLPDCACKVPQDAASLACIIADVRSLSVAHVADCQLCQCLLVQ